MKCSLAISAFLEISNLSYSIAFLCFFALITEEGSLLFFGTLQVMTMSFLFSLAFSFSSFLNYL